MCFFSEIGYHNFTKTKPSNDGIKMKDCFPTEQWENLKKKFGGKEELLNFLNSDPNRACILRRLI
jgi:hypothetical protein